MAGHKNPAKRWIRYLSRSSVRIVFLPDYYFNKSVPATALRPRQSKGSALPVTGTAAPTSVQRLMPDWHSRRDPNGL